MDSTDAILDAINDLSRVTVAICQFIRIEQAGTVVVVSTDLGKSNVKCRVMSDYRPEPLEAVSVLFIDGIAWFAGPAVSKPGKGTVSAVASGLATVTTDVGLVSCSYGVAPAVGDTVRLSWRDGPHISAVVTMFPGQQLMPPDPVYQPIPRTYIFKAKMSGQVIYPAANTVPGVWHPGGLGGPPDITWVTYFFYGPQIFNTIPSGATIQKVEIYRARFVGDWGVALVRQATSPAEAEATYPTNSPGSTFYLDGTYGNPGQGQQGTWWGLSTAFGTAVTASEVSVQLGGASGGGDDVPRMQGLDLNGDGNGDNLSGAIRITAIF